VDYIALQKMPRVSDSGGVLMSTKTSWRNIQTLHRLKSICSGCNKLRIYIRIRATTATTPSIYVKSVMGYKNMAISKGNTAVTGY